MGNMFKVGDVIRLKATPSEERTVTSTSCQGYTLSKDGGVSFYFDKDDVERYWELANPCATVANATYNFKKDDYIVDGLTGKYIMKVKDVDILKKSYTVKDMTTGMEITYSKQILEKNYRRVSGNAPNFVAQAQKASEAVAKVCIDSIPGGVQFIPKDDCECGAKHSSFPDSHSDWCKLYKELK